MCVVKSWINYAYICMIKEGKPPSWKSELCSVRILKGSYRHSRRQLPWRGIPDKTLCIKNGTSLVLYDMAVQQKGKLIDPFFDLYLLKQLFNSANFNSRSNKLLV